MEAQSNTDASNVDARPEHPSRTAPGGAAHVRAYDRQNKVQRIGSQTKGLFDDVTSWIELRLRLFQIEIQERVQQKVDEAIIKVAPVVVGLLGGLFALVTIALFVGWALGHPAWGFLVVTSLLFIVAGILYARSRRLGRDDREVDITGSATDGRRSTRGGSH